MSLATIPSKEKIRLCTLAQMVERGASCLDHSCPRSGRLITLPYCDVPIRGRSTMQPPSEPNRQTFRPCRAPGTIKPPLIKSQSPESLKPSTSVLSRSRARMSKVADRTISPD